MARFGSTLAVLLFAIAATGVVGDDPRPTLDEHKAGKEAAAGASAATAARDAKLSAVNKVMKLLADLKAQVLTEGEAEAATYNKFACFCKDSTAEKTASIEKGTDEQTDLYANINQLTSLRDTLDAEIVKQEGNIKTAEDETRAAEGRRAATLAEYKTNSADLDAALYGLNGAIKTLKGSKKPSLLQVQGVASTVRTSLELADALGLVQEAQRNSLAAFLQQPENGNEVPMEDYDFHSDGVIGTLEKLLKDFTSEKNEVDAAEVASIKEHDQLMQDQANDKKQATKAMEDAQKKKEDTIAEIEMSSKELSTVEAVLRDDKEYLGKLSDMCSDKAKTWDVRIKTRQDELSAITQAIAIVSGAVKEKTSAATIRFAQKGMSVKIAEALVKDPEAMEAVEADAEAADAAPAFIQKASRFLRRAAPKGDASQAVMNMLLDNGKKLHSAMLSSLATEIGQQAGADKFAKIKTLIQELIERLLAESAGEANQKGWCDKSLSDATQKRDYAAEEVMTLNANLAGLEATRDKLTEELGVLATEIKDLKDRRDAASEDRETEKGENAATITEAGEGLKAVQQAIEVLEQFYGTAANSKVDLSFAQKQPETDAPDAGFDNGEAYTGASGKAGGVIGMLEVIQGDFQRTVTETEAAEKQAEQDHLGFMTETGKSLAEKTVAETEKTNQKDDAEGKILEDGDTMKSQNGLLQGAVKELIQLQKTCIDTGMSYEDRVARREEEMDALKKALCIFDNFSSYGPDAASAGVC